MKFHLLDCNPRKEFGTAMNGGGREWSLRPKDENPHHLPPHLKRRLAGLRIDQKLQLDNTTMNVVGSDILRVCFLAVRVNPQALDVKESCIYASGYEIFRSRISSKPRQYHIVTPFPCTSE